jgi:hypothetical protein
MKTRSIAATLLTVVIGGGAAIFGVAAPASALTTCPGGNYGCVWGDEGFTTNNYHVNRFGFDYYVADLTVWNYSNTSTDVDDSADSGVNVGNWDPFYLYEHQTATGNHRTIQPQAQDINFSNDTAITDWHDKTSSVYFKSTLK